ncbi:MAG: PQQ-binding-like beta-propeller repeat protein [Spirochaetes bacterium]|nr:PQQ-binding-like beta-propeller repeat protein [Spirochaetota bacterium]
MADIETLLEKLKKASIDLPDALYENISEGIKDIREKKNKRFLWIKMKQVQLRYAVALAVFILLTGLSYLYLIDINVTVISTKGSLTASSVKNEWRILKAGERLKKGDILQTSKNSVAVLRFGKGLTLELKDENILKINELKKWPGHESCRITVNRGNQIYDITKNAQIELFTDDVNIRNMGTKFNMICDQKGTGIRVEKGKVALKRNIMDPDRLNRLHYENKSLKSKLHGLFGKETILHTGEWTFIKRNQKLKVQSLIEQLIVNDDRVNSQIISLIQKDLAIEKKGGLQPLWTYSMKSPIWASPVFSDQQIYLAAENGSIACLSGNGNVLWKRKHQTSFFNSGLVYKNSFYIIDSRGMLLTINKDNSDIIRVKQVGETMYSAPLVVFGSMIIATTSGDMLALEPDTGKTIWKKSFYSGIFSQPFFYRGKIFFGTENGAVYGLNYFNADIEWKIDTGKRIAISSPVVHNSILYIANHKGSLFAIETEKGKIIWQTGIEGKILSDLLIQDNHLYAATSRGTLYCFTIKGKIRWKLNLKETVQTSFICCRNDIILPTRQGNVYFINKEKGLVEKIIPLDEEIASPPVMRNNSIYITTMKGNIFKFSFKNSMIATHEGLF